MVELDCIVTRLTADFRASAFGYDYELKSLLEHVAVDYFVFNSYAAAFSTC